MKITKHGLETSSHSFPLWLVGVVAAFIAVPSVFAASHLFGSASFVVPPANAPRWTQAQVFYNGTATDCTLSANGVSFLCPSTQIILFGPNATLVATLSNPMGVPFTATLTATASNSTVIFVKPLFINPVTVLAKATGNFQWVVQAKASGSANVNVTVS